VSYLSIFVNQNHSVHGSLQEVEGGANRLAQVNHGASHLVQCVIPTLLSPATPGIVEWKETLRLTLERHADILCSRLSDCIGLDVIKPQGAMSAMVRIDTDILDVNDDMDFASKLLEEENVFILPGKACGAPNAFRVVYCSSEAVLETATRRISNFCSHHVKV
jgi:tyrosine aminotransferase